MEEQFYIMKPDEIVSRSFHIYPTTDQAGKYECSAILKTSDFSEVDRAGCQFTTTPTVLDNGSQVLWDYTSQGDGLNGFFASIKSWWKRVWDGFKDFITGKTCRSKCSSFFDFRCHVHYVCVSWILSLGLLLTLFPAVFVLLWLLHQKGFFDPVHDWWDNQFGMEGERSRTRSRHRIDSRLPHAHHHNHHHVHDKNRRHGKRRSGYDRHVLVMHRHPPLLLGYRHHLEHDRHADESHKQKPGKLIKHCPVLEGPSGARGVQIRTKHHKEKHISRKHGHGHGGHGHGGHGHGGHGHGGHGHGGHGHGHGNGHTSGPEFYSKAYDRDHRNSMV